MGDFKSIVSEGRPLNIFRIIEFGLHLKADQNVRQEKVRQKFQQNLE